MEVEYNWHKDGICVKHGRKCCILFVNGPGQYHCVVKVNDHEEESAHLLIVEEKTEAVRKEKVKEIGNYHCYAFRKLWYATELINCEIDYPAL